MREIFEYWYKAKCVDVYDGDTITCDVWLGFGLIREKQKLRLYGIDTPEIRGEERPSGLAVTEYVKGKILGKDIILQSYKDRRGSFGRWLATVYYEDGDNWINLNQELLNKGMAEEYKK